MRFHPAIYIVLISQLMGANPRPTLPAVPRNAAVEHVIWDGNQISTIHGNHGDVVSYHVTGQSGLEWPKGSNKRAVFQTGLWIAAGKVNGVDDIRTAVSEYSMEYVPGIINGDFTSGHIYRIHRAEIDAFLNNDWATFSSLTLMLPVSIITGSNIYTEPVSTSLPTQDFMNWPVADGAPWVDANGDGIYNPPDGDYPDISGDMFHWYSMNDADPAAHATLFNTVPMNLEVRVSMFGFDSGHPLENVLFIKWEIENAGTDHFDSVFVALWGDPDLGDASDDLVGCDPGRDLGYCYNDSNGDIIYGNSPPAVGYRFLQTPIVPSPGDTAWVSGDLVPGYRNLSMNAFSMFRGGDPIHGDPNSALNAYREMNGLSGRSGDPYIDPTTGEATPFVFGGDPVTGAGWVDHAPGDRRCMQSAGPFALAAGNVQEVVAAVILSQGSSNTLSLATLRSEADLIQWNWNSEFQNLIYNPQITELTAPHNTESIGPFLLEFTISDTDSVWSNTKWFIYEINGARDSTLMSNSTADIWQATLPVFSGITGTTSLHYWITLESQTGIRLTWPFGAPWNHGTLIFGPDTTAPTYGYTNHVRDIHYLLPWIRKAIIGDLRDDRFGCYAPELHWTTAEGDTQTVTTVYGVVNIYENGWLGLGYSGIMTGQGQALGDSIRYWFTFRDSSQNQNPARSSIQTFACNNYEVLGDWENSYQYQYLSDEWSPCNRAYITDFNYGDRDWGNVLMLHSRASDGDSSTIIEYLRRLDLTAFDQVWLNTQYYHDFYSDSNYGILEVSADGVHWTVIDSLWGAYPQYKDNIHYSLAGFTACDSLALRFRLWRSELSMYWIIDDIILHSDSSRLEIKPPALLPDRIALHPNYPNPFNPVTTIRYDLPQQTRVRLAVFDLLGREVAVLADRTQPAGFHEASWDAGKVASGIYFYQLENPNRRITRKMVLLK